MGAPRRLAASRLRLLALAALAGCASQPDPASATFTMQSRVLGEQRRINVHTPKVYAQTSSDRFQVLYMPDGGVGEDFPHIVETIDSLVAAGTIAPTLVVGIENTERRRDLTGPTSVATDKQIAPHVGGSAAFRTFVRDELVPEIERRYRCSAPRAIVGESLAGLFVVETLLLEPNLFDRYIAISPSLWWNDRDLLRHAENHLGAMVGRDMRLFLTAADETDIVPYAAELAAVLAQHAPKALAWLYEPMPDERHDTIFRAAKAKAFAFVLGR